MKRFLILPTFALLAACENGLAIPDFRGVGGDDRGTMQTGTSAMANPQFDSSVDLVPQTAKERLIAATEASGCVINVSTIAGIMQDAAVGNDELPGLVTELENDGLIAPTGPDGLRLKTPTCTA